MANEIYNLDEATATYHKVKASFSNKLLEQFIPSLKAGDHVIEIGPGQGHFASACRDKGMKYVGFEPSKILREELHRKGVNVAAAWVPPIPVKSKSCDMVYACTMVEHLPTYLDAVHFSNEVNRVLKDEKYFCMVVPNYLTTKKYFHEMDYSHSFITTENRLNRLLDDAGFEVTDCQHVINFYWVKSGFFHHIIRHIVNCVMVPVHWGITTWLFKYSGMGSLLWKIRKTFYEHLIITAKKRVDHNAPPLAI